MGKDNDANKSLKQAVKLEPENGIITIGSGGAYAQAAAVALLNHTELPAADIVRKSLEIAGELCIYTNMHHTIETLP